MLSLTNSSTLSNGHYSSSSLFFFLCPVSYLLLRFGVRAQMGPFLNKKSSWKITLSGSGNNLRLALAKEPHTLPTAW
ncbi:hypothetical protein BDR04DRAFT_353622 [Suillus decipiens]|nr:hypothetical protein BDR04DRAFT_353622 [Suillus decipiens]